MTLQERIARAEAATQELIPLEQLRKVASGLPQLLEEQRRVQEEARRVENLEVEREHAREVLVEAGERGSAWRSKWDAALENLDGLIREFSEVQGMIANTGWRLKSVLPREVDLDDGGGPPVALRDPHNFSGEWSAVGGGDPGLDLLPERPESGTLASDLVELLQRHSQVVCYRPASNARFFMRV